MPPVGENEELCKKSTLKMPSNKEKVVKIKKLLGLCPAFVCKEERDTSTVSFPFTDLIVNTTSKDL